MLTDKQYPATQQREWREKATLHYSQPLVAKSVLPIAIDLQYKRQAMACVFVAATLVADRLVRCWQSVIIIKISISAIVAMLANGFGGKDAGTG